MREKNEIILFALEQEKVALTTYLKFAYETEDQKGKDMFIRLAMDEFDHINALEGELSSLEREGKWCRDKISLSPIEKLIPQLPKTQLKTRGKKEISAFTALLTASELEDKAIRFYRRQKEEASDEISRSFWQRLEEMEIAHYELIQAEIDSLTRTGFWLGIREFTVEGER